MRRREVYSAFRDVSWEWRCAFVWSVEVSFWVRLESCHVRVVVWLEERVWTRKIDELVIMTVRGGGGGSRRVESCQWTDGWRMVPVGCRVDRWKMAGRILRVAI